LATTLFANICVAQPSNPQSVTNWGESVGGVQLSVGLTNNVVATGSVLTVDCRVKNSSTNTITWPVVIFATEGFDVFLTNSAGKVYRLTPDEKQMHLRSIISVRVSRVEVGETYQLSIPAAVGKEVDSGIYELVAKRTFSITDKTLHEVVSNTLQVQIK